MNETGLYKDVSRRLLELMQSNFGGIFKLFYLGAPSFLPPDGSYPCLVVFKPDDMIDLEATGLDSSQETIVINLIYNAKDDFNDPNSMVQDTTMRKIQNLVEGRDPTTGAWLPTSLIGVVRTNFTLDEATLGNRVRINYAITPQPDAPTIVEAIITLTVSSLIQVPNRN